jgi:two-component system sensor histidine kinase UhpB
LYINVRHAHDRRIGPPIPLTAMGGRYVPLFWRLLVPNVTVLAVACVVLIVEPADGRIPALAGGLVVMVVANAVLMRRATAPLTRLTSLMRAVDPLKPGQRLPVPRPQSEVTLLAEAFNDMLDRLETERRESGKRVLGEREADRRRVAAELHDQIGQTLTAVGLQVDRLLPKVPPPLEPEIRDIRDGVLGCVDDVRRIARELRPEALDTLGLIAALTNLSDRITRRTGVQIIRTLDRDLPPIDDDVAVTIYRIAQESMTNAIRHAKATTLELTLRVDDARLHLAVCDDGEGFDASDARGGIRGMRERALSIGATLRIERRPTGNGTEVVLEVAT